MEHIDFYDGRGEGAEWLGTLACHDASPQALGLIELFSPVADDSPAGHLFDGQDYREAVAKLLAKHDNQEAPGATWEATYPVDGWPHGRTTSASTLYAACWDKGAVWVHEYGHVFLVIYSNGFREPSKFPAFDRAAGT
jgi:hypothetical protein